ncbi:MAG: CDP-alcohol phosphatidyltransferase family protein [Oscillospiraceae bacterium]|nr:CDP-alcohol phosphatidyltransferase family protein [Oscillospiraceae bacterium]
MANIITVIRIICSIGILFVPVFSPAFYVLYMIAGVSDMVDGAIARKTGTVSDFGSKLDTAADIVMAIVCLIKMIPGLDILGWLYIWVGVIALIKVINFIFGYVMRKEFVAAQTVMNKVTGIALFLFPLTLSIIDLKYSSIFICALATFAAIQEGHLIRTGQEATER